MTNVPGMMNTLVSSCGISSSHSPLERADFLIKATCVEREEGHLRQIVGYLAEQPILLIPRQRIGWPLVMVWKELDFGGAEIDVSPCSSTHSDAARFRIRRTIFRPWLIVPTALPSRRRCSIHAVVLGSSCRRVAAVGGRAWRSGLLARARAIGKIGFDPPPNPVDKDWSSCERSVRSPRLLQSDGSRPFEPGCWEH